MVHSPDRAIDLSCRACGALALGAGLGFPVGASAPLCFAPPTSDFNEMTLVWKCYEKERRWVCEHIQSRRQARMQVIDWATAWFWCRTCCAAGCSTPPLKNSACPSAAGCSSPPLKWGARESRTEAAGHNLLKPPPSGPFGSFRRGNKKH